MGLEPFLVSSVMAASFAQRLVRKVCPDCKTPYSPTDEILKYWQLEDIENANFVRGKGCFNCMHTGYRGRTGVYEVLVVDENIQNMILNKTPTHEITGAVIESGAFTPMRENAIEKVVKGITTFEEAASAVEF
jgi:type IV pilus assembly protein PilB